MIQTFNKTTKQEELLNAGMSGEILVSESGLWKLAEKLRGTSDASQALFQGLHSGLKRWSLQSNDTSTVVQLMQALQAFANTTVSSSESKLHLRTGARQLEVITGESLARVNVMNGAHGGYLIVFDTHPQVSLMSNANNNQNVIDVKTAGDTNFTVKQNGETYCKGLVIDIPSKGNNKVLKSNADGLASWENEAGMPTGSNKQVLANVNGVWTATDMIQINNNDVANQDCYKIQLEGKDYVYIGRGGGHLATRNALSIDSSGIGFVNRGTYVIRTYGDGTNRFALINSHNCTIDTNIIKHISLVGSGDRYIGASPDGTIKAMPDPSGSTSPLPSRTLFVSPTFNNTFPYYNTISQANQNSNNGDTIIVYPGDYSSEGSFGLLENVTLHCIGEVKINEVTLAVYNRLIGGSYNQIDVAAGCYIDVDYIRTLLLRNSENIIKAKTIENVNASDSSELNTIEAQTVTNFNAYNDAKLSINADKITNINIYEDADVVVNANLCNAITIGNSSFSGSAKAIIEIHKIEANNISILNTCKAFFKNCQIKANEIRLDNECNAKFHNCVIVANNSHVFYIRNMNHLLLDNCNILNQNTSGVSIHSDINPMNVYARGDCYSNVDASSSVNFVLGTVTTNVLAINEFRI